MKIKEYNAFVNYASQKRKIYLDGLQDFTALLKDMQNISVKDRSSRAKKLLKPLEKATNELKEYTPSLSQQTPEKQEAALAWKEALTNAMMCRVEELKILSSNKALSQEDVDTLLHYDKQHLEYYNETIKQGDKLDSLIK